jgi:hypothetical protein
MSAEAANLAARSTASRRGALGWVADNRALTAAAAAWILFAVNFNLFMLDYVSDPIRVYHFLQRLFGDRAGGADAYEFGLAFAWTPFYALGKAFVSVTGVHSIGGKPALPGIVALSAGVFALAAGAVLVPVMKGLRLHGIAFALLCAIFGTPLFYYASFNPGHTHAFETLLMCSVVALLYRYFRGSAPPPWIALGIGALVTWAVTVRYFLAAPALALVLGLAWYRRWRDVALVVATPAVGLVLAGLAAYETSGDVLQGASEPGKGGVDKAIGVLRFAPLNPYRMLFTEHRGLFVWTPVALIGAIGFVHLLRRRVDERPFLSICAGMAVATVAAYVFAPFWDGGGPPEFSQRYLTSLFPYVALGVAALLEWRPVVVRAAGVLAVAWSLFIGIWAQLGIEAVDSPTQPIGSAVHGKVSAHVAAYNLYRISNLKFAFPDPFSHG